MLDLQALNAQDLQGLSSSSLVEVAAQMLMRIGEQSKFIAQQAQAIKFKDVKIERITLDAGAPEGLPVRCQNRTHGRPAAPDV